MPFTALGKNLMLNAHSGTNPATPTTHAALFQENAGLTGVTGVAATGIFTKAAHGYVAGDLLVFRAITGGTGFKAEFPVFVIATNLATNTFSVSLTPGGTIFNSAAVAPWTVDISAATSVKLVELTGGSPAYARKAIAFAAAGNGLQDDSTNGAVFDVPAAATVNYCGFFSALTVGTLNAIKQLTTEVFSGQGTYTLTDAKLDLNNDVLP